MRQVVSPALKVKPDSNGSCQGITITLPKVPQKSLSKGLWHRDHARASRPYGDHSPAIAQDISKRLARPRQRRRR